MIKVAHISDSHFDERGRLDDCTQVHEAFALQVAEWRPDVILHTGDLFERRSTPAERNQAANFLIDCSRIAPVIIVKGNHDAPGDLEIFGRLKTHNFIFSLDRPTRPGQHVCVRSKEGAVFAILALPWFDRANLAAMLPAETDQDQLREATIDAGTRLLDLLRMQARDLFVSGITPILAGHLMVGGSETSTGQTLIGSSVEFSPAALADLGCPYVALGHIHKHQSWCDGRVAYAGSPYRCNFGEPEAKGWLAVEIDPARVRMEFRPLPARQIQLIEVDWSEGVDPADVQELEISQGAMVRFRYRISAQNLHFADQAEIERVLRGKGAFEVQLEAMVTTETRARAPEIVDAPGTWDKVRSYLAAKSIEMQPEEEERLRGKLSEIESGGEEAGHAAA